MQIKPYKHITPSGPAIATELVVTSLQDNLLDAVTFRCRLMDADGAEVATTHVSLNAGNYGTWDATAEGAHRICAAAIGLTLI